MWPKILLILILRQAGEFISSCRCLWSDIEVFVSKLRHMRSFESFHCWSFFKGSATKIYRNAFTIAIKTKLQGHIFLHRQGKNTKSDADSDADANKIAILHMRNKCKRYACVCVCVYVCGTFRYVWACICVAFPWNAIEIRDNIMPVNCCTRERKVKERAGGGGRRGRGKETDESFHLPQCGRQKQFSQLCFCAGPRLENELQVVWSRGMVGGGQQQQTTPYNNNKNKSKFNNGGHGCCCCCGCRWWWQSIQRTGL